MRTLTTEEIDKYFSPEGVLCSRPGCECVPVKRELYSLVGGLLKKGYNPRLVVFQLVSMAAQVLGCASSEDGLTFQPTYVASALLDAVVRVMDIATAEPPVSREIRE